MSVCGVCFVFFIWLICVGPPLLAFSIRCHGYNLAPRQTRRLVESARLGTSCAPPTPRVSLCPAGPLRGSRQRPRFRSRVSCLTVLLWLWFALVCDRCRFSQPWLGSHLLRPLPVHITAFADVAIAPRRRPAPPSCAQRGLPPQETVFFLPSLGGFCVLWPLLARVVRTSWSLAVAVL